MEYELVYSNSAEILIREIKIYAKQGYVVCPIQPTVAIDGSYRYVLLMERDSKPKGEI